MAETSKWEQFAVRKHTQSNHQISIKYQENKQDLQCLEESDDEDEWCENKIYLKHKQSGSKHGNLQEKKKQALHKRNLWRSLSMVDFFKKMIRTSFEIIPGVWNSEPTLSLHLCALYSQNMM